MGALPIFVHMGQSNAVGPYGSAPPVRRAKGKHLFRARFRYQCKLTRDMRVLLGTFSRWRLRELKRRKRRARHRRGVEKVRPRHRSRR